MRLDADCSYLKPLRNVSSVAIKSFLFREIQIPLGSHSHTKHFFLPPISRISEQKCVPCLVWNLHTHIFILIPSHDWPAKSGEITVEDKIWIWNEKGEEGATFQLAIFGLLTCVWHFSTELKLEWRDPHQRFTISKKLKCSLTISSTTQYRILVIDKEIPH